MEIPLIRDLDVNSLYGYVICKNRSKAFGYLMIWKTPKNDKKYTERMRRDARKMYQQLNHELLNR